MIEQAAKTPPAQAPGRSGASGWRTLLRWALTLGLLALLFAFVDFRSAVDAVSHANPALLAAGLVLNFVGTIFLPGMITQLALSAQDRRMSIWRLTEINLTNRFYVLVLPRAASLAIRWYRYGEGTMSTEALALMMFERGVQLAALMVLSLGALWIDQDVLGRGVIPLALVASAGTAGVLVLLLPFASASTERLLRAMLARLDPILPAGIHSRLERLVGAAAVFRGLPQGPALAIVGWSLIATLCFFGSAWFAARAIGLEISLVSLVWIRSLVFLMTLVPITIGGIGVRELGFVGLLGFIGVSAHAALAFSAVNFSFQVAQAIAGAAIECWRLVIAPHLAKWRPGTC
jgi:uncharacterized membrane protein YbhN (UPF0104 family)